MSKNYWNIHILDTLSITKYCKKCQIKQVFISSDLFRINAQKNYLDIWLIYRCQKCSTTWNMTIHERISPRTLDKELYMRYLANDVELAKICTFNRTLLQKNNVVANFDQLTLEILGPNIQMNTLSAPIAVTLHCLYDLDIRVEKLLRLKLGLSRSEIKCYMQKGKIHYCGSNLSKAKFYKGIEIVLLP